MKSVFAVLILVGIVLGFNESSYIKNNHPGNFKFSNYPNMGDSKEKVLAILGNPDNVGNSTRHDIVWVWGADAVNGGGGDMEEYWNAQTQINFTSGVVSNIRITSFYISNNPIKSDRLALPKVKEIIPPWVKKKHLYTDPSDKNDMQRTLLLAAKNGVLVLWCQVQSVDYANSNPPEIRPIADPMRWRVFSVSFRAYDDKNRNTLDEFVPLK